MNKISEQNRKEANEKVDKNKREKQVLEILYDYEEATPKKIAKLMLEKNYIKTLDYNHVRPRLTGLLEKREVCIIGKKLDYETNCKEAVYKITSKGKERICKL